MVYITDPKCSKACGENAECVLTNEQETCICLKGFQGDPNKRCLSDTDLRELFCI